MPRDQNSHETESLIDSIQSLTVHTIPLAQLYSELSSSSDGLRSDNSKDIRARVGYNKVPPPLSAPAWLCCLLPCLLRTKAMMEYNECVPEHASVRRNKNWVKMDSTSLVPGDIVMVRDGERVPADIRIIETTSPCKFDTSAINGEVNDRKSASTKHTNNDYLITENMAFCGYLCVEGNCKGIVVSIAEKTVIGTLINQKKWPPKTPSS